MGRDRPRLLLHSRHRLRSPARHSGLAAPSDRRLALRMKVGRVFPAGERGSRGRMSRLPDDAMPKPAEKKNVSLASVRRTFWTIVWPRRRLVLMGLLLVGINRLSGLVLPGSTKYLIDNVIAHKDTGMLKLLLVVVGGAILVQALTSYLLTRLLSVEAQHLISVLRAQMQQHILRLPIAFFDNS